MTDLLSFDQIRPTDLDAVGGKGLSLGLMSAAGLPVPPGFCITTAAFRRLRDVQPGADPALRAAIDEAYRLLGGGLVAVRSSATAEDSPDASFAGQQETILGVQGEADLHQAVRRCWASLHGERAVAYRRRQGVSEENLAMAVVVQRLVAAEVAGVLFTRDPLDPSGRQMLVEASWGLGETVVSGRVTPDRFHLDRETGRVADRHIAAKTVQRTSRGEEPVGSDRQTLPSLSDRQLADLGELGRKVEAFYREPRDVEWAFADGRFWLLQARPITASFSPVQKTGSGPFLPSPKAGSGGGVGEREQVRQAEIARLKELAAPGGTVWSRFNLAEVLPAPTPMSWAVVRRLMSGAGGFGRMYRDLGYDPDPGLDEQGVFDLVCGRPYCNLSREPRLHYRRIPFEHPFAGLKADSRRALYPTPTINPARFPWWFWLAMPVVLPWLSLGMIRGALKRERLSRTFAARFRDGIAPAFRRETEAAWREDLSGLDDAAVLASFEHWVSRTLVDFARDSLKPTALAALSLASLEQKLGLVLGPARAKELARELVMGVRPPPDADLAAGVRDLVTGDLSREDFLKQFGHRGPEEMELSRPRWGEDPSTLEQTGAAPASFPAQTRSAEERLAAEPKLNAAQRLLLLEEVSRLHAYLGLRESAKHHLMYGYALIRRALVELDGRYRLDGGVFLLTPEELPRLLKGEDLSSAISRRRRERRILLGLETPPVLFSDDLEALGRQAVVEGAEVIRGVPLSAGAAEGPALVLEHPHVESAPPEGYVLVCPSTDPAWAPLFVGARGLVMETGGVLSHGAIVAREFGLPAVAGVPGVLRRIRTGQKVRVDGGKGEVTLLAEGGRMKDEG
jgi:pyruvate,water dikinase